MTTYYVDPDAMEGDDGESVDAPWTWDEFLNHINTGGAGDIIYVKAGTYYHYGSGSIYGSGAATTPIVVRGYSSTPGDLDGKRTSSMTPGTNMPLVQMYSSSNYFGIDGTYWSWENIAFKRNDNANRPAYYMRTDYSHYNNCRFIALGTGGTSAYSCEGNGGRNTFIACSFEITSASASAANVVVSGHNSFHGCVFKQGTSSKVNYYNDKYGTFSNNFFIGGSIGFQGAGQTNLATVVGNTFYNCTTGATYRVTSGISYINNLFHTCTTGIDSNSNAQFGSSGDNNSTPLINNNSFFNCSTNIANVNANTPARDTIAESSDPLTNAGTDFSLVSGASSLESGFPYMFPLIDQRQYLDVGAVQKEDGGGGGGGSTVIVIEE